MDYYAKSAPRRVGSALTNIITPCVMHAFSRSDMDNATRLMRIMIDTDMTCALKIHAASQHNTIHSDIHAYLAQICKELTLLYPNASKKSAFIARALRKQLETTRHSDDIEQSGVSTSSAVRMPPVDPLEHTEAVPVPGVSEAAGTHGAPRATQLHRAGAASGPGTS